MNFAAMTLLCWGTLPGQKAALPNLDFRQGTEVRWIGEGFYVTTANPRGADQELGVCSSDAGNPSRKAMLRYIFDVPQGTGLIRFQAFAALGKDFRIEVFHDAGEDFFCDERETHRIHASKVAWEETLALFRRSLPAIG